ncbi:MAG: GIY-YIG nuclease family protein [Patescibacteria group bacterium]
MRTYYVYILKCSDGSYYAGITNYLERRIYEHQQGLIKGCYTHSRRPLKCVFAQDFNDVGLAIQTEKQIKGWSRKKKESLIKGDFNTIKLFAKRPASRLRFQRRTSA